MKVPEQKTMKPYKFDTTLTQQMYDELITLQKGTHFRSLSALCRHILAAKKVVAEYIKNPSDSLFAEITAAYKALQQKCSALNQLTAKIFVEGDPSLLMTHAREARRIFQEVNDLLDPIQAQVTEISKRWLPDEETTRKPTNVVHSNATPDHSNKAH